MTSSCRSTPSTKGLSNPTNPLPHVKEIRRTGEGGKHAARRAGGSPRKTKTKQIPEALTLQKRYVQCPPRPQG